MMITFLYTESLIELALEVDKIVSSTEYTPMMIHCYSLSV